jgi:virulence factor Mce-like protein
MGIPRPRASALRELLPARLPRPGRRVLVTAVVLALVAAGAVTAGLTAFGGPGGKHVTAYFDRAVGIYKGSDLRVLGVKVGTVEAVRPKGKQVEVDLRLDSGVKIPRDPGAVVVAPSVVADRYVQLTPAYAGGPQIEDHAVIPATRTATPVEIDQLYDSITRLSDALGPDGANTTGALSDLLDVGARNLDGNGKDIGDSITQLGNASKTLDGNSADLFATLSYLQSFTAMLKTNDGKVKAAADQLATVTGFLAADKQDLGGALQQLSTALGQVKTFIETNRGRLKTTVDQLQPLTRTLVNERASLAELLDTAPLAADNLLAAYDPAHHTIDGRTDINELSMGKGSGTSDSATTDRAELPLPFPAAGGTTTEGAAR